MKSELNTNELFNLLKTRYEEFLHSGGKSLKGGPYNAEAYNALSSTLRDLVESFYEGRLVVGKPEVQQPQTVSIFVTSDGPVNITGDIKLTGNLV
ncbi:MAG: hypothetical protein EOO06_00785 [Chitinophagaceae bacterium]|nr:MAG: hypothetical protein EOO06_00785 [Chitinophagaceae bacterium]